MNSAPRQLASIQALTDVGVLKSQFGDFDTLSVETLSTTGYSGAGFSRLRLRYPSGEESRFVLKKLNLDDDWFSHRSNDRIGREAAALVAPELTHIHRIFRSPYRLVGIESAQFGLLMDDVSHGLFPDEKTNLPQQDQDLMLDSLAALHACYWEAPRLSSLTWLQHMADFIYLMGPLDHQEYKGGSARDVHRSIKAGWQDAMSLLPVQIKNALLSDPEEIVGPWKNLPLTLVHGDSKVANFAKAGASQLCLLDWAFVGHAPCTFDVGWFLAVNATRLFDSKEAALQKYRSMLEARLGHSLDNQLWQRLEEAGVVCGAFMLLWAKASAVSKQRAGAELEWNWWISRLERWAATT